MKRILFVLLFASVIHVSYGQNTPTIEWAKVITNDVFSSGRLYQYDMAIDQQSNIYLTGEFSSLVDLGLFPDTLLVSNNGNSNTYLAKYDSAGRIQFAFALLGDENFAHAISVDNSDNIILVGEFEGIIDLDPSPLNTDNHSSIGGKDIFVAKYDSSGNYVWGFTMGAHADDIGYDVATNSHQDIILTGTYNDTIDLDPSASSIQLPLNNNPSNRYMFVAKYDSSGNYLSNSFISNRSFVNIGALAVDKRTDEIYVGANIYGTNVINSVSGVVSLTSNGGSDILLLKYDEDLSLSDHATIGSGFEESCKDLFVDSQGNLYIAGNFAESCDIDPTSNVYTLTGVPLAQFGGQSDGFIAKYGPNWDLKFGTSFVGTGYVYSQTIMSTIIVDSLGYIYVSGVHHDTLTVNIDQGQVIEFYNYSDLVRGFIYKFDSLGNYVNAAYIGIERGAAQLGCFVLDRQQNIYSSSGFRGRVDMDPSPDSIIIYSGSDPDLYLAKHDSSFNYVWGSNACEFPDIKDNDLSYDITQDTFGNIYLCGYFEGTIDLDPSPSNALFTSHGNRDVFVAKYDSVGNYINGFNIGNDRGTFAYSIAVDNDQNVFIGGMFRDTVDFDPSINGVFEMAHPQVGTGYWSNAFIASYDSTFQFRFADQFGYQFGGVKDIEVDNVGNIHFTGHTFINERPFIAECDQYGNSVYFYSYNANVSGSVFGYYDANIVLDNERSVYIVNGFTDSVDVDMSANTVTYTSVGGNDVFVAKYDSTEALVYSFALGGSGSDVVNGFAIDDYKSIYICGTYVDSIDLDPSANKAMEVSAGETSFFAKYDSSGRYLFSRSVTGARIEDIVVKEDLSIVITGTILADTSKFSSLPFVSPADHRNRYEGDAYIAQYNRFGSYVYVHAMGDEERDYGLAIANAKNGSTLYTGMFTDTAYIDPADSSNYIWATNSTDIFFSALSFDLNSACQGVVINNSFRKDTICANDSIYIDHTWRHDPGVYFDTLSTMYGCDSIVTIELTVLPEPVTNVNLSICEGDVIIVNGTVQNSTGTYYDTLSTQWGCDSIVVIDLNVVPTSRTYLTDTVCAMYISPSGNHVWTTSGVRQDTLTSQVTGCDSVLTINLYVYYEIQRKDTLFSCGPYVSITGNQTWNMTGSYTDTITQSSGCLRIIDVWFILASAMDTTASVNTTQIQSKELNASYQWLDCDNNYAIIPNENGRSFIPSTPGNYAVELTRSGCIDTSNCYSVATVGVNDLLLSEQVTVYPNPTTGNIVIDMGAVYSSVNVTIRNVIGQVVSSGSYNSTSLIQTNISTEPGIYFVELTTANGQSTVVRIVKQ